MLDLVECKNLTHWPFFESGFGVGCYNFSVDSREGIAEPTDLFAQLLLPLVLKFVVNLARGGPARR